MSVQWIQFDGKQVYVREENGTQYTQEIADWLPERFTLVTDDNQSDWEEFLGVLLDLGNVVYHLRDLIYIASVVYLLFTLS